MEKGDGEVKLESEGNRREKLNGKGRWVAGMGMARGEGDRMVRRSGGDEEGDGKDEWKGNREGQGCEEECRVGRA